MSRLAPGKHPFSELGPGLEAFHEDSYCFVIGEQLWLSMILIKEIDKDHVMLKVLIDRALSTGFPTVLIPDATPPVRETAMQFGFRWRKLKYNVEGVPHEIEGMVWE